MAFVQQQRRRTQRRQVVVEDLHSQPVASTAAAAAAAAAIISDSDTDWHVISSTTTSPILFPSESESSFRPSDTDRDTESDSAPAQQQAFLPSHDGTGTFVLEDLEFFSSDQTSEGSLEIENNLEIDTSLPHFVPTAAGLLNSQELIISASADDRDHVIFTTKEQKNLDSIPIHHPGIIPGSSTSAALISIVWDNLKRLTNHLIENDTNTVETLSTLMSEAVMEGCIPFGSHLHMELESYQLRLGDAI